MNCLNHQNSHLVWEPPSLHCTQQQDFSIYCKGFVPSIKNIQMILNVITKCKFLLITGNWYACFIQICTKIIMDGDEGINVVYLLWGTFQVYLEMKEPARACTECKLGLSVTGQHSDEIIAKLYFRFVMIILFLYKDWSFTRLECSTFCESFYGITFSTGGHLDYQTIDVLRRLLDYWFSTEILKGYC